MSAKITVVCLGHSYQAKRNAAEKRVRRGGFRWVDRFTIQEIPRLLPTEEKQALAVPWSGGPVGSGNILPFARRSTGDKLHYEIPMAGDVGIYRHLTSCACRQQCNHSRFSVSHRNIFAHLSAVQFFSSFGGGVGPMPRTVAVTTDSGS